MIVAIVQARMSSSRLPGKVLLDLVGTPVLKLVYQRLSKATLIDKIIIATSDHGEDDAIEAFCNAHGILCYRGALDNVLDRFIGAANYLGLQPEDIIIRVTADCPLIDYEIIDHTIQMLLNNPEYEYCANVVEHRFPDGYDVEAFKYSVFGKLLSKKLCKSDLEHVTIYLHNHPSEFKMLSYRAEEDYGFLRLTLDEPADFQVLTQVIHSIVGKSVDQILLKDIVSLHQRYPEVFSGNNTIKRNEGYWNTRAGEDKHEV